MTSSMRVHIEVSSSNTVFFNFFALRIGRCVRKTFVPTLLQGCTVCQSLFPAAISKCAFVWYCVKAGRGCVRDTFKILSNSNIQTFSVTPQGKSIQIYYAYLLKMVSHAKKPFNVSVDTFYNNHNRIHDICGETQEM